MSRDKQSIRVALVGCGQIADAHLQEIRKIPFADVVAVCDTYQDLADQAAARFGVPQAFTDMQRMLEDIRPDAVHITTPVQTHAPLAIQAIEAGVHVYVEKPFTIDVAQAESILESATMYQRLVCLGHDQSFDPIWLESLSICRDGEIGDVQHIESVLGYPIDGHFGRLIMNDAEHWVRRLPGGLFQNTMSHPLYRITDLMPDESPKVWATWFSHTPQQTLPTELRVHLQGRDATAYLLFTSTTRPLQRITRVYGTKGGFEVDLDAQVIRRYHQCRLPGAFQKIEAPWRHFTEAARNLKRNLGRLIRSDIHYFAGMNRLFRDFYQSILDQGEPPIPYSEILRVTRLLDNVFHCCRTTENASNTPSKLSNTTNDKNRHTECAIK